MAFQWAESQAGVRSGKVTVPKRGAWPADSEASSSLSAHWVDWWGARHTGIAGNQPTTPSFSCPYSGGVLLPAEFQGGGYVLPPQVPVRWTSPSQIPWGLERVKPDTGMTTYSEGNNRLNMETIQLIYFKETTSSRVTSCKPHEWLKGCLPQVWLSLCCKGSAVLCPYLSPEEEWSFFVSPNLLTSLFTLWRWFDPKT